MATIAQQECVERTSIWMVLIYSLYPEHVEREMMRRQKFTKEIPKPRYKHEFCEDLYDKSLLFIHLSFFNLFIKSVNAVFKFKSISILIIIYNYILVSSYLTSIAIVTV